MICNVGNASYPTLSVSYLNVHADGRESGRGEGLLGGFLQGFKLVTTRRGFSYLSNQKRNVIVVEESLGFVGRGEKVVDYGGAPWRR